MTLSELLPAIGRLTLDEKWQFMDELHEDLYAQEPGPAFADLHDLLEARIREFEVDPSLARPWTEVRQRLHASLK